MEELQEFRMAGVQELQEFRSCRMSNTTTAFGAMPDSRKF
jgi:hypothetical protein